jgi:hypothetical protein
MLGSGLHALVTGSYLSALASESPEPFVPPTTYTQPSRHSAAHVSLATLIAGSARHCLVAGS